MATDDDHGTCPDGLTHFDVGLEDEDVARLMEVADLSHADPRTILASIIHDVLHDDAMAHADGQVPESAPLH